MKINLKIEQRSSQVLFKRLLRLRGSIRENVAEVVEKSAGNIRDEAKARAPRASGALVRSLRFKRFNEGLTAVVFAGGSIWYDHLVEFGSGSFFKVPPAAKIQGGGRRRSKGHKSGGPYRPPAAGKLRAWAERKNLPVFPVARAIGLRGGVKARPFLYPALETERKRFTRGLVNAIMNKSVRPMSRGVR